jgi:peptide/nickel transport system substrate-binding protein
MTARTRLALAAAAAGVSAALVSSCALPGGAGGPTGNQPSDMNPQPRDAVRDGGVLRISLDGFPVNFNVWQIDGNTTDTGFVINALMPSTYVSDAQGNVGVDHDFFTDIRLTGANPQTVEYAINPAAVWSDGSPITWRDLASQAQALSGRDPRYLIASSSGYDRIASVTRGVDDRHAIVTFARPYGSWLDLFSPLYPESVTATPDAFNTGDRDSLPVSAGPFAVRSVDRVQSRLTVVRNPRWWGARPKLDAITFSVLDRSAWVPGVQNNEIDATDYPIRTLSQVKQANNAPNVALRRAPDATTTNLTFNGAPGSLFADQRLRLAISKAVDRQGIARALLFGLTDHPVTLDNHIYLPGQPGYVDNSALIPYDPDEAARELDALGWRRHGDFREKDGKRLIIRFATNQSQTAVETAQIVQQNLAAVGARLDIQTYPDTGFYSRAIIPGNFDLCGIAWSYTPFPLQALDQIYAYDPANPQSNFGRIGTPRINALIQQASSEMDPGTARAVANEIDRELFAEGFSIPLFQMEGNYPVRTNLANYGASGLATLDYTAIGFLK